jgi:hypothetical protein
MSAFDAFLSTWARARATFGEGVPHTGQHFDQSAALNSLATEVGRAHPGSSWSGAAATQYGAVNAEHRRVIDALGQLDSQLAKRIDQSAQIVGAGRRDLDSLREWALASAVNVPKAQAGQPMLAAIASAGLGQVVDIVTRSNGELNAVGNAISTIGDRYRELGIGQKFGDVGEAPVQAFDYPQAPPSSSYPINEVVAEATDLDGNHVILRRGYYDAKTQKGFGWDKAYWRHHVVNPNVFSDLISHSRPISDDGGTVVYEVPINRVHCPRGFLGTIDCEDTGESVTMRIVANLNEGNPSVPGGGQKGVISMYPLAGGSGVVEVQPGWTLTPPWVNNNVPIN